MGFLQMPKASRKMQKTLKNLRVSVLCFLLTFLVLRNTVGAGKFGTPAQDFEEIRQHLHYVRMHRKHYRVLAEVVEDEKKQIETPLLTVEERSEEGGRLMNAPLHVLEEEQGTALIVKQGRALQGGFLQENVGLQKDLEILGIESLDEEKKAKKADPAHTGYGASRVLLLAGVQSSACNNPAREHFLLKSLKNKADYATLHGLEISVSFGGVDPETAKPLSKFSLLQATMARYPHAEWLWWMPSGALIADMSYALPIENYTEFNLVFLGSDDKSLHRKSSIDLNTDTFLIRNCQWSLDLLRACVHADVDQASRLLTSYLLKGPHGEARDQCALISPSNQKKDGSADRIYTEHAAVLSGNWRDVVKEVERVVGIGGEKLPFVTHFLGCDACQKGENEACARRLEKVISSAEKQSMQSYVSQRKSLA